MIGGDGYGEGEGEDTDGDDARCALLCRIISPSVIPCSLFNVPCSVFHVLCSAGLCGRRRGIPHLQWYSDKSWQRNGGEGD